MPLKLDTLLSSGLLPLRVKVNLACHARIMVAAAHDDQSAGRLHGQQRAAIHFSRQVEGIGRHPGQAIASQSACVESAIQENSRICGSFVIPSASVAVP